MKKLISIALALVMILSLATVAFADAATTTNYKITIKNPNQKHTYFAYLIFEGDLAENGTLSNIHWGDNVNTDADGFNKAIADCLGLETPSTGTIDAATVAEELCKYGDDAKEVSAFADVIAGYLNNGFKAQANYNSYDKTSSMTVYDAGYYLIMDKVSTDYENEDIYNDSFSKYILCVVGNVEATPKASVPTLVKKVMDANDSTGDSIGYEDSADHDIGDNVSYRIVVTLPSDFDSYESYKIEVHDIMSPGLTYNGDAKIYIDHKKGQTTVTSAFEITSDPYGDDGETKVTFKCDDLKKIDVDEPNFEGIDSTCKIRIEYTCKLNENAVIGFEGNPNEAYLVYSNNPNYGHEGETGQTPKDKVIVFTYQLDVNKIDVNKHPLKGAGFTLYKWDASAEGEDKWVAVSVEVKGEDMTTFTFKGLDDGKYKLSETTTPEGYNTIKDIEFEINAKHDETSDDPKLTEITINDESFTAEQNDESKYTGVIKTDVVNKAGSQLPETGGIGTTIFYVLGAMMVVGAAVLLVTKKRMSAAE